jgi:hypothetical protein
VGRYIIKTAPDEDLYMEWSSFVDAPTFVGNRKELAEYLAEPKVGYQQTTIDHPDAVEERLQWTDMTGSSMRIPGDGWDSSGLVVQRRNAVEWEGYGFRWLPRAKYSEYARRVEEAWNSEVKYCDMTDILEEIDPNE